MIDKQRVATHADVASAAAALLSWLTALSRSR
jgi:hypothetical protein